MHLPNMNIDIKYVKAARFPDEDRARRCYREIVRTCMNPERGYDLGVNTALWQKRYWVVVVMALTDDVPEDVQRSVDRGLRRGTPWEVPVQLVEAIALRRLRSSMTAPVRPDGMIVHRREGQYVQIDELGRDRGPM